MGLALAMLAVGASAADEPAKPADDAIAGARREFDTFKGSRNPGEMQKIELPSVDAPTLNVSSEESAFFQQSQAARKKAEKEKKGKGAKDKNWLVDAMTRENSDSSKDTKPNALPSRESGESISLVDSMAPSSSAAPDRVANASSANAPSDNPLTGFMSSWMTTKDFDLLKVKGADTAVANSADRTVSGNLSARGTDVLNAGPLGLGRFGAPAVADGKTSNPYLADLDPVPSYKPKEQVSPTLPGGPPFDAGPAFSPVKNDFLPARTDAPVGDPLKASKDAKYFPQLKRF
ncbi:MAG: hypothetical protein JWM32_939 [Verrucomicrobia bacterium]|nr:hypothetical protein [Verrucomicrobiota bacterium]